MNNDAIKAIQTQLMGQDSLAMFKPLLGASAIPYINSVLIVVRSSDTLQKCTPASIVDAAYRAANLGLSCDPIARQAHLVAYKNNSKGGIFECQFQAHYNGLRNLALRTQRYAVIEVIPIPKGYDVLRRVDSMELMIVKTAEKEEDIKPVVFMPKCDPVDAFGFLGYMRTKDNVVTKVFRTVQEIRDHAKMYSKSWKSADSLWHHKDHKSTMEMKTVLIELLKYADLSDARGQNFDRLRLALDEAKAAGDVIDAEAMDIPEPIDDNAESSDAAGAHAKSSDVRSTPLDKDKVIRDLTGTTRVDQLKEKAEKDLTTAYWEAVKDAGLDTDAGQAVVKEMGGFKKAFNAVIKQYGSVINGS